MGALLSGIPQRDDVVDVDLVRSATQIVLPVSGSERSRLSTTQLRVPPLLSAGAGNLSEMPHIE